MNLYRDITDKLVDGMPIGLFRQITYNSGIICETLEITPSTWDSVMSVYRIHYAMDRLCYGVLDLGDMGTKAIALKTLGIEKGEYETIYVLYREDEYQRLSKKSEGSSTTSELERPSPRFPDDSRIIDPLMFTEAIAKDLDAIQNIILPQHAAHKKLYDVRCELQGLIDYFSERAVGIAKESDMLEDTRDHILETEKFADNLIPKNTIITVHKEKTMKVLPRD